MFLFRITGPRKAREAYRHFGPAPGVPHSHTAYVSDQLINLQVQESHNSLKLDCNNIFLYTVKIMFLSW